MRLKKISLLESLYENIEEDASAELKNSLDGYHFILLILDHFSLLPTQVDARGAEACGKCPIRD